MKNFKQRAAFAAFFIVLLILATTPADARLRAVSGGTGAVTAGENIVTGLHLDGVTDDHAAIEAFMLTHDCTAILPPGYIKLRNLTFGSCEDFHLHELIPGTVHLVQDYDTQLITLDATSSASAEFTITAMDTVTVHGARQTVTAVTKANPAVATYSGADSYANGNKVAFTIKVGMRELNDYICTVANVNTGANTFECSGLNSTAFTTFTTGQVELYDSTDNDDNVTELTYTGTLPATVGQLSYGVVSSENTYMGEDTLAINSITKGATTTIETMSPFSLSSTPGSSHWANSNIAYLDYISGISELNSTSHNKVCTVSSLNTGAQTFSCNIDTSASTGAFRTVRKKITAITNASPPVVTYSGDDLIYGKTVANGDILELAVSGMTQIRGQCTVANVNTGANTFECSGLDSRAWGLFSAGYVAPLPITDITKAAPGVVTTKFAHGLNNGDVINLVIDGMDELDGSCTVLNKTATTFQCNDGGGTGKDTTNYTSFADGYIGDEGYVTIHKSVTWMAEPVQVMQVFSGSHKILLYNQIFYQDRMKRNPTIRFLDDTRNVSIGDFIIETPDHAGRDWLDTTIGHTPAARVETILMRGLVGPEIGHLKFNGYWSVGLYRSAVMNMHIGSIEFFGGTNDITPAFTSFGYGLRDDGPSGFNVTENLWSSAMNRHAYTTGGINGTSVVTHTAGEAYAAADWWRRGYNRFNVLQNATCHNSNGQCIDTHEQTVDFHVGHVVCENAITGPTAYGSGSSGCVSNRSVNAIYDFVSALGGKFGVNAQAVEHGVNNTFTLGTFTAVSSPTGKDQDVALRSEDMTGLSHPFFYNVGTFKPDNYGKGFLIQDGPQEVHIADMQGRRLDRIGQLSPGAKAYIDTGSFDTRFNERQPTSSGFLLSCDAVGGAAELHFASAPTLIMGNTGSKPTSFIDGSGSSCTNTVSLPGVTTQNPYNVTIPAMVNDEAAITVETSNIVTRRIAEYCFPISDFNTTAITAATGLQDQYPFKDRFYLTGVRATTVTAPTGLMTIDVNEGGTSVLSTKLTIDANERTSNTAAAAAVISDHSIAAWANVTVDVDSTTGGKGGVVCFQGF